MDLPKEVWVAIIGAVALLVAALINKQWGGKSKPDQTNQSVENGDRNFQAGSAGDIQITEGMDGDQVAKIVEAILKNQPKQADGAGLDALNGVTGELSELTKAVQALTEQSAQPDAPPAIAEALAKMEAGDTENAEAIFEQILNSKKAEGYASHQEAAAAARHIGALAYLHDTQKALDAYRQSTELDPDNANGWNMLGLMLFRIGELDGTQQALEKVLSLGNSNVDKKLIAMATGNLGLILQARGDLEEAEAMHREALALNEVLGCQEGMAEQYCNLGLILCTRGDLDGAEAMYRKSLALNEELGNPEGMAGQYGNLGTIHGTRGDLDGAEAMFRKSLALEKALGSQEGMANQYGNLGLTLKKRGDLDGAEEMYKKNLSLEEALGRKQGKATNHLNMGTLYNERGDKSEACRFWGLALALYTEMGMRLDIEQIKGLMDEAGCPASDS